MSQTNAIDCGLPFCYTIQGEQTKLSIGFRVTATALGTIAVLIGTLILCDIPTLSLLGTTSGWIALSVGLALILTAVALRYVKKAKPDTQNISSPQKPPLATIRKLIPDYPENPN